jgi:hypothetical protein
MNDDIIKMAREAGGDWDSISLTDKEFLTRFAELVAADEQKKWEGQTVEPAKWHHPECEGECIACLIERLVQEAYGIQGLSYLQRHLTSSPAQRTWVELTDDDIYNIHKQVEGGVDLDYWACNVSDYAFARAVEEWLKERNT